MTKQKNTQHTQGFLQNYKSLVDPAEEEEDAAEEYSPKESHLDSVGAAAGSTPSWCTLAARGWANLAGGVNLPGFSCYCEESILLFSARP